MTSGIKFDVSALLEGPIALLRVPPYLLLIFPLGVLALRRRASPSEPRTSGAETEGGSREWWAEQGSNLRPRPCKGRALPAELSARALIVADLASLVNS